jgi:hypothetical protein
MHPIRARTLQVVQETMHFLDELKRMPPDEMTATRFVDLRRQFIGIMHDVQDLLIEMGPTIEQICERYEEAERLDGLQRWFAEALSEGPANDHNSRRRGEDSA